MTVKHNHTLPRDGSGEINKCALIKTILSLIETLGNNIRILDIRK